MTKFSTVVKLCKNNTRQNKCMVVELMPDKMTVHFFRRAKVKFGQEGKLIVNL